MDKKSTYMNSIHARWAKHKKWPIFIIITRNICLMTYVGLGYKMSSFLHPSSPSNHILQCIGHIGTFLFKCFKWTWRLVNFFGEGDGIILYIFWCLSNDSNNIQLELDLIFKPCFKNICNSNFGIHVVKFESWILKQIQFVTRRNLVHFDPLFATIVQLLSKSTHFVTI
jgi:hypothetical protein